MEYQTWEPLSCVPSSPQMLGDIGVQWVILGHSERRAIFNESSQVGG